VPGSAVPQAQLGRERGGSVPHGVVHAPYVLLHIHCLPTHLFSEMLFCTRSSPLLLDTHALMHPAMSPAVLLLCKAAQVCSPQHVSLASCPANAVIAVSVAISCCPSNLPLPQRSERACIRPAAARARQAARAHACPASPKPSTAATADAGNAVAGRSASCRSWCKSASLSAASAARTHLALALITAGEPASSLIELVLGAYYYVHNAAAQLLAYSHSLP